MLDFTISRSMHCGLKSGPRVGPSCAIAIPVRNEAESIARCLDAIERADQADACLVATVLVLNGCTDATWDAVAAWTESSTLPVLMVEVTLAPQMNHAGGARAVALQLALQTLPGKPGGIVLTTDADSQVPTDWLARAVIGISGGCDVIAGDFDIEAASLARWPSALRRRVSIEDCYARLLDEVDALCDPVPHNPWPTHRRCSGANLVFRADALAAFDTLPAPPCGEDRALVAACLARDMRVRHDPQLRVQTSGRLKGRAAGGMAETLRMQDVRRESPCDPLLEAFAPHVHRALVRSRLRRHFQPGISAEGLMNAMGLRTMRIRDGLGSIPCHYFGQAWQQIESMAVDLMRVPLQPSQLPGEIDAARTWLAARCTTRFHDEVAA